MIATWGTVDHLHNKGEEACGTVFTMYVCMHVCMYCMYAKPSWFYACIHTYGRTIRMLFVVPASGTRSTGIPPWLFPFSWYPQEQLSKEFIIDLPSKWPFRPLFPRVLYPQELGGRRVCLHGSLCAQSAISATTLHDLLRCTPLYDDCFSTNYQQNG